MPENAPPAIKSRVRIKIEKIAAQKDQYAMRDGSNADGDAFVDSGEREAELVHFKRFVVRGIATKGNASGPFTITISVRGKIVVFAAGKGSPVDHEQLGAAFAEVATQFDGSHLMRVVREPIHHVMSTPARCVCTVADGFWFADVLHHIRDGGNFEVDVVERPGRVWPIKATEALANFRR